MQEIQTLEGSKEPLKDQFPGKISGFEQRQNEFEFTCENKVKLRIIVLNDQMIRFRFAPSGIFQNDFSYAIDPTFKVEQAEIEFKEKVDHFRIVTKRVICRISKDDMTVKILDKSGTVILEDEKGFHWEINQEAGGEIVQMSKRVQAQEYFYGLGDKSGKLNMRKNRFEIWGTDAYQYGKDTDPLYKNVPFYYGLHNNIGYGVFFDNSFRSYFDFGHERANVCSFWANGGEMDYYFFYGPELMEVAEQFATLTGKPELPPLWALGYHQCKWSYYPESNVKEICKGFRDLSIPCDAIYLDIDYMDGFRCFTWDNEKFPDPKRMVAELAKDGFKTVVMIDPGIKVDHDYWVCKSGIEENAFCVRGDGPLLVAPVWPGDCYFPDFTNPKVRDWWGTLYEELIKEIGVKGVWNDMNEPAIFKADNFTQSEKTFYDDVRHDYDGNPCSHKKAHNVYGMQMTRATYDGIKKIAPDLRPFVLTRSSYAGGQRFSSGWTGDNVASWEHLKIANWQCQRLNISGMSFVGSDIGGFIETPDGELYTRWLQMAIFHPFFRTHSSGDHGDQEPWSFGEPFTSLSKKAIEFRYKILPYIYTSFWQHCETGRPILRSLAFMDQTEKETLHRMEEFGFGELMLVCPISQPNVDGRWMFLPKGQWYNYWNDDLTLSNVEFWAETQLDEIPIFVRAGSVIPMYPVQQYVGELAQPDIMLHIYFINGQQESQVYLDAGDGYGYENGDFSLRDFKVNGTETALTISQQISGEYKNLPANFKIKIHALPTEIMSLRVDDKKVIFTTEKDKLKSIKAFDVAINFKEINIQLG